MDYTNHPTLLLHELYLNTQDEDTSKLIMDILINRSIKEDKFMKELVEADETYLLGILNKLYENKITSGNIVNRINSINLWYADEDDEDDPYPYLIMVIYELNNIDKIMWIHDNIITSEENKLDIMEYLIHDENDRDELISKKILNPIDMLLIYVKGRWYKSYNLKQDIEFTSNIIGRYKMNIKELCDTLSENNIYYKVISRIVGKMILDQV